MSAPKTQCPGCFRLALVHDDKACTYRLTAKTGWVRGFVPQNSYSESFNGTKNFQICTMTNK
jgi:hypothetical protein